MKKIALATLLSFAATSGFAAGPTVPIVEPEIVVEEDTGTSGGIVVPILLVAIIAAVVASD